jgi:hypothetical protein
MSSQASSSSFDTFVCNTGDTLGSDVPSSPLSDLSSTLFDNLQPPNATISPLGPAEPFTNVPDIIPPESLSTFDALNAVPALLGPDESLESINRPRSSFIYKHMPDPHPETVYRYV